MKVQVDLDSVLENLGGESKLGPNHTEILVAIVIATGDSICQIRLIVDVYP